MKIDRRKLRAMAYPAILGTFFAVLLGVFLWTTFFLSQVLNSALTETPNRGAALQSVDIAGLGPIATRLGLEMLMPVETEDVAPPPEETQPQPTATTTEETMTSTISFTTLPAPTTTLQEPPPQTATSSLQIAVYNSTQTTGLAAKLKIELEKAGFTVKTIGSLRQARQTSLIQTKIGARSFLPSLQEIMSRSYVLDEPQTIPDTNEFDVIITIGQQKR